jgi:hypothetical protein
MKCLNNQTDQQLVHLYMNGDADALATLVVRYKGQNLHFHLFIGKRQVPGGRYFPGRFHPYYRYPERWPVH